MNMKLKRCQKIFQSEVIGWGSMGFVVYTQSKKNHFSKLRKKHKKWQICKFQKIFISPNFAKSYSFFPLNNTKLGHL